jgi:hypothetical protein
MVDRRARRLGWMHAADLAVQIASAPRVFSRRPEALASLPCPVLTAVPDFGERGAVSDRSDRPGGDRAALEHGIDLGVLPTSRAAGERFDRDDDLRLRELDRRGDPSGARLASRL